MLKKLLFFMILLFFSALSAAVPGKIPVQGTLMDKDGNLISDDAAEITFVIYDAETDGNELWKEERTLFVEKGKLAIYLGEIEPVTYEKIGGQEELWLSVTYDGEEMSRIQLGSVPYAHEAQVAHQAEAVGKYTETTLDDYFSAACAKGSFLRGWSGSSPICETDEGGESGTPTYTAGTGISIDGEVISVDQTIDLYVAGTGIYIDEGTNTISVNPSIFATTDHNHDGRYYTKTQIDDNTYNKSEVYTKTQIDDNFYDRGQVYTKLESNENFYTKNQQLFFSSTLYPSGQYLSLWNNEFGIGMQKNTHYFRSQKNFGWYTGGVHSSTEYDPGGGTILMSLNSGGLNVNTLLNINNNSDITAIKGLKSHTVQAGVGLTAIMYNGVQLKATNAYCSIGGIATYSTGTDFVFIDGNGWNLQVASGAAIANCLVWNW